MNRRRLLEALTVERFTYAHQRPPQPLEVNPDHPAPEDTEIAQAARRRVLKELHDDPTEGVA